MKLSELVNARKTLSGILAEQKLPFPVAYKIAKFFSATDEDEKFYDNKLNELLEQYGENTEDGKRIIPKDNVLKVNAELEDLGNTEVEDCGIRFTADDFSSLNVLAKDSYHSELVDLLTENVAVVDNPSSKGSGNN